MLKSFTILFALMAMLSACSTMQGLGTDIQKAGRGLEDAAR
jgi:predicted small secreted protein